MLILVFTPAFGALSDATGLVNRFDIETGGHVFEITTTANFNVNEITFDKDQKQLTLYIESSLENNLGELIIPNSLLSGNFTFFLNDKEFHPEIKSNQKISFITMNFTGIGKNKVDVFASNYLDSEVNSTKSENDEKNSSSEIGGCLIATATFDSELSPQVQKLRELRDNKLLETKVGSDFMNYFNSVYYSFSPQIADMQRESPMFNELIKAGITPLLYSLSILNFADSSEFEIVGLGFSIILLNLGIYFVAPALIIKRLVKK